MDRQTIFQCYCGKLQQQEQPTQLLLLTQILVLVHQTYSSSIMQSTFTEAKLPLHSRQRTKQTSCKEERKEESASTKARYAGRWERGLYVKTGIVKLDTKVLQDNVTGVDLAAEPLFEEHCIFMRAAPVELFDELRLIKKKSRQFWLPSTMLTRRKPCTDTLNVKCCQNYLIGTRACQTRLHHYNG